MAHVAEGIITIINNKKKKIQLKHTCINGNVYNSFLSISVILF